MCHTASTQQGQTATSPDNRGQQFQHAPSGARGTPELAEKMQAASFCSSLHCFFSSPSN